MGALNRGGTEMLLLNCFKHQASVNLNMSLVHRKNGALKDAFYTSAKSTKHLKPRFPFDPLYLFKLRKEIKQLKPDVIHAMQAIDLVYAALASIGLNIPLVITFHGFPSRHQSLYEKFLLNFSFSFAHKLLFVSNYQQSWFQKEYHLSQSKLLCIHNGVDFSRFENKQVDVVKLANYKWKFGSVGNFTSGRNPFFLCELALLLHKKGINFSLELVGLQDANQPELYNNCFEFVRTNGLADNVFFLGSRSDIPELLLSWDAFLYATNHDTFGLALVEAMGAGLPVFVNDWPVMKEIAQNGALGYVYETGNVISFFSLLNEFFENHSSYLQAAIDHIEIVRSLYGIEKHLNTLNTLYQQLIEKHCP
jgi:glycosyltransferase involved in cell wall biosynthesis